MDDFYGDGCRLAARENYAKNRGEPQLWFKHKADFREGQQAPRIRPEARDIVEKNSMRVSTACLAGFADRNGDSNQVQGETVSMPRQRLRTAEAGIIANRLKNPQEEWFDFEGNQTLQVKSKPPRVGASEAAAEFMRQQNRSSDWFTTIGKPVSSRDAPRMRLKSSATADLRASSSDWFTHHAQAVGGDGEGKINSPNGALRKNTRRVREEGFEYAERSRGQENLLKTVEMPDEPRTGLYRCPTRESRRNCCRLRGSLSMAACLQNSAVAANRISLQDAAVDDYNHDYAPTDADGNTTKMAPKVHGEEAMEWRSRGIGGSLGHRIFAGTAPRPATALRVRPEAVEIRDRMLSGNQLARRIMQQDKDIPLSPFRRSKMISSEAQATFLRNRVGEMNELIGKDAKSTTSSYPSKVQARVVNSDAARSIQARSTGAAAQELLTHTNLCEARPADRNTTADARLAAEQNRVGSVGALLGYHDRTLNGSQSSPPQISQTSLRLTNTEARTFAEQQRDGGTMRELMMTG
ncbi:hypothetical protein AAHC03_0704 [Spirometra sp. Aus1]